VYEGPPTLPAGVINVNWVIEMEGFEAYFIAIGTIAAGKTFEDLDQWVSSGPPPFFSLLSIREVTSSVDYIVNFPAGEYHIMCYYKQPETHFGTLGPVVVEAAEP
jgi:hypothetical protein